MRKLFILACAALTACACFADGYKTVPFSISNVTTSATPDTVTVKGLSGEVLAYSLVTSPVDTNMVVAITTSAGYGMSQSAARDILASQVITNGIQGVVSSTYLGLDRVVFSAHTASTSGVTCTGAILIKE